MFLAVTVQAAEGKISPVCDKWAFDVELKTSGIVSGSERERLGRGVLAGSAQVAVSTSVLRVGYWLHMQNRS